MRYTQIPANAFKQIQLNAGILCSSFNPATATVSGQIGATSGGVTFSATPTFKDFGEDIDNCPKNMLELKKLENWEITLSGTYVTIDATAVKNMIGASDVDTADATHIIPRNDLAISDFGDVWWVGDYSDENGETTGSTAGYVAIRMMKALSTGGFKIKSNDKAKGTFDFEYTAHYSMTAIEGKTSEEVQKIVPFEVYIKAGSSSSD